MLGPATVELNDLISVSLKLSIGNFSPDLLIDDPVKKELAAKALEVGALEVSVHDNGAVDFAASQVARSRDQRGRRAREDDRGQTAPPRGSAECRFSDWSCALGHFLAKDGER